MTRSLSRVPGWGRTRDRIALSRIRGVARGVRWYVRELTGEAAYDRYVTAHAGHDAGPAMTRAQWWRARADAQEGAGHERCC